jgi:hypothetical protein
MELGIEKLTLRKCMKAGNDVTSLALCRMGFIKSAEQELAIDPAEHWKDSDKEATLKSF